MIDSSHCTEVILDNLPEYSGRIDNFDVNRTLLIPSRDSLVNTANRLSGSFTLSYHTTFCIKYFDGSGISLLRDVSITYIILKKISQLVLFLFNFI